MPWPHEPGSEPFDPGVELVRLDEVALHDREGRSREPVVLAVGQYPAAGRQHAFRDHVEEHSEVHRAEVA